jgi:hypothetical protein
VSGAINHGLGIGAMWGAGALGASLFGHSAADQTAGGHLFDATVTYTQAMIGFGVMNGLTGHALRSRVGGLRLRFHYEAQAAARTAQFGIKWPAWERHFATGLRRAGESGGAAWSSVQRKAPRLARAQGGLEALLTERDLPEAGPARVNLSERLEVIQRYFSYWSLKKQRSVEARLQELSAQVGELSGDTDRETLVRGEGDAAALQVALQANEALKREHAEALERERQQHSGALTQRDNIHRDALTAQEQRHGAALQAALAAQAHTAGVAAERLQGALRALGEERNALFTEVEGLQGMILREQLQPVELEWARDREGLTSQIAADHLASARQSSAAQRDELSRRWEAMHVSWGHYGAARSEPSTDAGVLAQLRGEFRQAALAANAASMAYEQALRIEVTTCITYLRLQGAEAAAEAQERLEQANEYWGERNAALQERDTANARVTKLEGINEEREARIGQLEAELEQAREDAEGANEKADLLITEREESLATELTEARRLKGVAEGQLGLAKGELGTTKERLEKADAELTRLRESEKRTDAEIRRMADEHEIAIRDLNKKMEKLEQENVQLVDANRELGEAAGTEVSATKEEATRARDSSQGHKIRLEAFGARITELENWLRHANALLAAERFTGLYFHNIDPRTDQVPIPLEAIGNLTHQSGGIVGQTYVLAGGREGTIHYALPNGSSISGKTSIGLGREVHENSIAATHYRTSPLPGSPALSVQAMAWVDGAGGEGGGDVVSSGFVQGAHAALADAAYHGEVLTADQVFTAGAAAAQKQKAGYRTEEKADGAGGVLVVIEDHATVATAGDAPLLHLRPRPAPDGRLEVLGYTNIDRGNDDNSISRGVATSGAGGQPGFNLYQIKNLQNGDILLAADDGVLENIVGPEYKLSGSATHRLSARVGIPDQTLFRNLNITVGALVKREDAAWLLHDLAVHNMQHPNRQVKSLGPVLPLSEPIQMPKANKDNGLVMLYVHGASIHVELELPPEFAELESVHDLDTTERRDADRAQSTARHGRRSPPPSAPPPRASVPPGGVQEPFRHVSERPRSNPSMLAAEPVVTPDPVEPVEVPGGPASAMPETRPAGPQGARHQSPPPPPPSARHALDAIPEIEAEPLLDEPEGPT